MTDLPPEPRPVRPISRSWRTGIAVTVMVLCGLVIAGLLVWGSDDNSLHTSALAWSYALIAATLAGLGIAAIAPDVVRGLTGK